MEFAIKGLLQKFFHWTWRKASQILPANHDLVIVSTFPDFDDSARAVKEALAGSQYTVVFVVADTSQVPDWVDTATNMVLSRRSLRAIIAFHRSKWVVITHGLYSELPRTGRQFYINLWHGMPVKKVGALLGEQLPHSDVVVAANAEYRGVMSEVLRVREEQVIIAPHPRIDIMLSVGGRERRQYFGNKWVILWLPTFRERAGSKGRDDGSPELSVLRQIGQFVRFHECLRDLNAVCVIKPHPLEVTADVSTNLPDSIQFWTDSKLIEHGLSLYQLIGLSDALITDVSSVYFEYQQLDRPIFCFFPDIEAYESSRGFVRPFETLINEPVLRTEAELVDRVLSTFQGRDRSAMALSKKKGGRSGLARSVLRKCGLELP